jgi:peptide/nickel transport system substrate-binding protein
MLLNRLLLSSIVLGLAVVLVTAPYLGVVKTSTDNEGSKPAKEHLVIGSIGSPSILNPYFSADSSSSHVESLLFNGLVTFDPQLKPVPDLAESWEVSEDGYNWTFHLRKGVRFHDGKEMTADDVVFSYNIPRTQEYNGPRSSDFEKIKQIRAADRYTVQISLKEPYAPFLSTCTYAILPSHILQNVPIEKMAEHVFNTRAPIGTGPYQFREWKEGQYIKLEQFNDYYQGTPFIRHVYFRIIPDQNAQLIQLQSGGIDMMGIPPTDMTVGQLFEKQGKIRLSSIPSLSYSYIGYNLQNPMFKDIRVRQALTYALDRQLIVDVVLDGQGQVAHTHGSPLSWAYQEDLPHFPYDVVKAKQLLKEAGWYDTDGDGVLDKNGKKFSFVLMTNQGNKTREMVTQIAQEQWAEVGVEVIPRLMEWSAFINDYVETQKFDAVVLGWSLGVDPDPTAIWHSREADGGLNFISYSNKTVDELLEKNTRMMNQQERKKVLVDIQEIIAKEQPYTFLYYTNGIQAFPPSLQGTTPHPAATFYQIHHWSFQ